jgi:hypothetical protein
MRDADGRLPSFIIGGAAKSGTSTLHALLDRHPDIYIPDRELYFFSIDDYEQHPEFFVQASGEWIVRDWDAHREEYLAWYRSFFHDAPAGALIGEDSTSYLPSARAAGRIREVLPEVKLIFLLRDPASRTYSQYWHDLRVGRITDDFEGTLRYAPGTLLERSRYREQVARYLDVFPREQLKFLLFEDLIAEPERLVADVSAYLGVSPPPPPSGGGTHRNPARVPRSMRLQLLRNRLFRSRVASRFQGHLPGSSAPSSLRERAVGGRWARLMLRRGERTPPMRPETRRFLDEYFAHENDGLDALIGIDVTPRWYRAKS